MPDEPETSSTAPARPGRGLDVRILLATLSLFLLIVPFTLTLFLVEDRWAPLWRADSGARDGLHRYAVSHPGFVTWMQLVSDSGSAVAWLVVLALLSGWLLWRRLPRLALFVVVTATGSAMLNAVVKEGVHRLRPVLADGRPGTWAELSEWSRPVGDRRVLGAAARDPAHAGRRLVQSRHRVRRGDGPGSRLLADCPWRPLCVGRLGRIHSWRGMGGRHGGCVQHGRRRS